MEVYMRKFLLVMFVLAALSFVLTGCGDKKPEPLANPCFNGAPSWVIDPSMEGGLTGLGSAKIGPAGMAFARTEAMAVARDEIARSLSVKVKNMFKNFTQQTGVGDDQTVEKVATNVSKQVASQTLTGARAKNTWISPCNEMYILVVLDPETAQAAVKKQVQTSLRNEKALWQQFQAKKAQEELDKEIEKEFGGK
jgi:hypothetical protein